jgi:lysozyme
MKPRRFPRTNHLLLSVSVAATLLGAQPAAAALTGPDVSSWQHPNGNAIDWAQVRSAGNSFAFVKATEGPTGYYQNPYFASDWAKARAAGLIRGAYHFARPQYPAVDQANYFISLVGNRSSPGDLPPVLDLEQNGGLAPAALVNWTQAFLSQVQALTNRTPMLYSYPSFIKNDLGNTTQFAQYPLWLADWTGGPAPSFPLGGWGNFTFWQYTDAASIPGISGNVDKSYYCCDSRGIDILSGMNSCTNAIGSDAPATHPSMQVAAIGLDCSAWVAPFSSMGFQSLGGLLLAAPAVVPAGPSKDPYYIATGGNGNLYVRTGTTGWQALTTGQTIMCIDNPAAVVVGTVLWVACQGWAHDLMVAQVPVPANGVPQISSSNWHSVGGILTSGPGGAVMGANTPFPEFFVTGSDQRVWTYTPSSSPSTAWSVQPEYCNGHPAAATYPTPTASPTPTTTYFACQGLDRSLWTKTFSSTSMSWTAASSLGGVLIDGPGVAAGPAGPTFFMEGSNRTVWERNPAGWANDGGQVNYGVGAAYIP